jgi:hypothetical protein
MRFSIRGLAHSRFPARIRTQASICKKRSKNAVVRSEEKCSRGKIQGTLII